MSVLKPRQVEDVDVHTCLANLHRLRQVHPAHHVPDQVAAAADEPTKPEPMAP